MDAGEIFTRCGGKVGTEKMDPTAATEEKRVGEEKKRSKPSYSESTKSK